MANLLDLLWDLVERPQERAEYLEDPTGYVRARGRGDLTGEDVKTALDLVRDLVPADLAAAIEARTHAAPSMAMRGDEAPLDGALRRLSHVVDSVEGLAEAGPRPDPKDTDVVSAPAVTPAPAVADFAGEDTPPEEEGAVVGAAATDVFDPTALRVEGDPPPEQEVLEPVADLAAEPVFDPSALVLAADDDDDDDMAEVVELSWDDELPPPPPEPSTDRDSEGVFAFGPGPTTPPADHLDETPDLPPVASGGFGTGGAEPAPPEPAADDADEPDEPDSQVSRSGESLFKKKSKLTLPTLGIDAAEWYDDDSREEN